MGCYRQYANGAVQNKASTTRTGEKIVFRSIQTTFNGLQVIKCSNLSNGLARLPGFWEA